MLSDGQLRLLRSLVDVEIKSSEPKMMRSRTERYLCMWKNIKY